MDGVTVHQKVEEYLTAHPKMRPIIQQQGEGVYTIDGRVVKVGYCRSGFLVVHDGPLRQPFTDYIEKKDCNQQYHHEGLKNSTLCSVPKNTRISFGDEEKRYSRLDAMKVAKEQANFREKAATYLAEGQAVPLDLREKYEKTIDIKLGKRPNRQSPPSGYAQADTAPPAWSPTATAGLPVASIVQPMSTAPLTARQVPCVPMAVPTAMAAVSQNKANLFGQVPDLLQIASARGPRVSATPMPGTVATSMPAFGASKGAAFGPRNSVIAGPLCGA